MLPLTTHHSPLTVNRSPLSSVSVVGTLRAAYVFDTSLSALILCVRKENISVVVICLTQRAQRTRRFIFPCCSRWCWSVYIFNRCNLSQCSAFSCRAEPATSPTQVLFNKIFALFASSFRFAKKKKGKQKVLSL